MKNTVSIFLLLLAFSSSAQQKQNFDLATFTIPNDWKKISSTADATGFAITNNQKGTYCQVGIYKSMNSMGNAQLDFETDWQDLIAKPYKVGAKPETGLSTSLDGWETKSGVAPYDFNGVQSMATLVTMSGYGKRMSIVILTNSQDYQTDVKRVLESVDLKKPAVEGSTFSSKPQSPVQPLPSTSLSTTGFAFTTTNFDDGWVASQQEDWVQVTKGNTRVLVHYPNKNADAYNSVLMDGLRNAWNILVAPKYSTASNFEFKPISGWQSIEFAEADAVEKATGKTIHVVLFKMDYSNGNGKYLEFITPDKMSFEQEFGAYHETSYGWEKMENLAGYNKFAVAPSDLKGKWTNDFSGALQYVNAYTGADAGMATHASNENFEFGPGDAYKWDLGVASGNVGNIKFQSVKSNGQYSMSGNWQVTFSDIEGKPRTFGAFFSCVKGAQILWLDNKAFAKVE